MMEMPPEFKMTRNRHVISTRSLIKERKGKKEGGRGAEEGPPSP